MNLKIINNIYKQIYSDFIESQEQKAAEKEKKYHKYDSYHSFGIRMSLLNKLLKKYQAGIKDLSCKEVFALALKFYKHRIQEIVLAGNFVLQNRIECISKTQLPLLDKALNYFCSWSTIDDFCIDILQPILLKYPQDILCFLKKWNKSKNIWKRRASVVVFVRKIGESGKFTNEALSFCENLLWDKNDLVQKGVGWCLKDIMRGDKKKVFTYIKKLRKQGVSAIITLYAIRDLTRKECLEILNF
ncbi:MAG: DNA alkylation repair protein [Patescibacteria group bacterium]